MKFFIFLFFYLWRGLFLGFWDFSKWEGREIFGIFFTEIFWWNCGKWMNGLTVLFCVWEVLKFGLGWKLGRIVGLFWRLCVLEVLNWIVFECAECRNGGICRVKGVMKLKFYEQEEESVGDEDEELSRRDCEIRYSSYSVIGV